MSIFRNAVLATTLVASAAVSSTPAMARDYYRDRGRDNTAAIAIGAGVIGLAVGAIAASNNDDRRYRHRDRRYYDRRAYDYRVNDSRYYRGDRYYNRGARYDGYRDNRRDWNRGDWRRGERRGGFDDRYYSRRGY